jgi:YVTN family beta-propeller protein
VRNFSGVVLLAILLLSAALLFAAEGPNSALLVLNKGEANLAIVDPATMKVVARIPTGKGPHEVATDGKLAFVANYGDQTPGNSLSVIDLASQKELRRVDLGSLHRPHGIVAYGGKVYFTVELNKLIARYDPQTDKVDWLMGTGQEITHMLVMNKDGSAIFTANILGDSVTALQQISGARVGGRRRRSRWARDRKASTCRPMERKCGWRTRKTEEYRSSMRRQRR